MGDVPNLFHLLRPACVAVAKDPSASNLQHALEAMRKHVTCKISDGALLQYVTFPFKLTLEKKVLREEQKILCYKCLQLAYSSCSSLILNKELLLWNLNIFSLTFFSMHAETKQQVLSEEIKLAVVELLITTFSNVNITDLELLYEENQLPLVGHVISILLNLVENEKDQKLQLASLCSLKLVCGEHVTSEKYKKVVGQFLSSFLPGIAMMFNRHFTKNQLQQVIVKAISTFSQVICLTLNDNMNPCETSQSLETILNPCKTDGVECKNNDENLEKSLKVNITKEWIKKTVKNLDVVFGNILPLLMCNNNVKVRLALVDFLESMLTCCMQTLSCSIPEFLDALVKLTSDSYDNVKCQSEKVLQMATRNFQNQGRIKLKSLLDEKLYAQFFSLPRIMNSANEDVKLAKLQILKGYLNFYGDVLADVLNSYNHLKTFLKAILQVLKLDHSNINLVEEKTDIKKLAIDVNETSINNKINRKHFKLFNNIKILATIKDIIRLLACHGDVYVLSDYLLEECRVGSIYRAEVILVLNELILSCKDNRELDLSSISEMLVEAYLEDDLWKLPVTNKHLSYRRNSPANPFSTLSYEDGNDLAMHSSHSSISFETLHNNIQIICLLLEGMGVCAEVLGTNFNVLLINTLYPVLEKIGSINAAVSETAMETLTDIVTFCNYENISDLILINADYLINSVTMQFRHLVHGSAAPAVLCVVLRFCSKDMMVIVADAVGDVFRVLDDYQDEVAEEMLNVLKCFAIAVNKWYTNDLGSAHNSECMEKPVKFDSKKENITSIYNDNVSIKYFFEEYCRLSSLAAGDVSDNEDEGDNEYTYVEDNGGIEENEEEEKAKEIPLHYQVVVKSLKKCITYIAAVNDGIKLKTLDVIVHGVTSLRQREDDLLPALHELWPAIIRRMKDTDQVIVLKTLEAINVMVKYSGDFLRKRMTTEFLPSAVHFLDTNSKIFTKDRSKFTQLHRVQQKLLSYLGDIVPTLEVSKEVFCDVATVCARYINCRLHEAIQEVALQTLRKFYCYRPAVIWILLQSLQNTEDLTPPHHSFKCIKLSNRALTRNEYTDNIVKLTDSTLQ